VDAAEKTPNVFSAAGRARCSQAVFLRPRPQRTQPAVCYLLDSLPELRDSRPFSEPRIFELDEPDDLLDVLLLPLLRSLDPVLFFMLEESELLFLCPMSRSCVAIVS